MYALQHYWHLDDVILILNYANHRCFYIPRWYIAWDIINNQPFSQCGVLPSHRRWANFYHLCPFWTVSSYLICRAREFRRFTPLVILGGCINTSWIYGFSSTIDTLCIANPCISPLAIICAIDTFVLLLHSFLLFYTYLFSNSSSQCSQWFNPCLMVDSYSLCFPCWTASWFNPSWWRGWEIHTPLLSGWTW